MPPESRIDILALVGDGRPMRSLLGHLRRSGCTVDVARDLATARAIFFGSGGHHLLLVGPDVTPNVARQVVQALSAIDPELATVTFGPRSSVPTSPARTASLVGLHPSSRAGVGALMRWIKSLPERR